jgi:hypothetical protein
MGEKLNRMLQHPGELSDFGNRVRQITDGEYAAFTKLANDESLPAALRAPFNQCLADVGDADGFMPRTFPAYAARLLELAGLLEK